MGKFYCKLFFCFLLLAGFSSHAQTTTVTLNADPKVGSDGTTFDLSGNATVGTFGGGSYAFANTYGTAKTATVTISRKIYIASVYFSWGTNVQGSSIEFYDGTTLVKSFAWPGNATTATLNVTADKIIFKDNGSSNNGLGELQKITYSASAPQSSNANLSSLTLSSGTLSPAFAAATTNYSVSVANSVTSLTVIPTVADATATVKVNGVSVASGNTSDAIALNVGSNTVTVLVTAQDGSTKTYSIAVSRAAPANPATISTSTITNITSSSATLGGNITSDGGAAITERGIVYGITANPTTADNKVAMGAGTGSYSQTVTGLTSGTTYYARAYAINSAGTSYGTGITFSIPGPPAFNSTPVTAVDYNNPYTYSITASVEGDLPTSLTAPTLPAWLNFSTDGQSQATLFGSIPAGVTITGVAGDEDGNIYAVRSNGSEIYKITSDGTTSLWKSGLITGSVYALHISKGYLYIPRHANSVNSITRIPLNNPEATEETFATMTGGALSLTDKDGFIYAANYSYVKIYKINEATKVSEVYIDSGLPSGGPFGLTFDDAGDLLIATWINRSIIKYNGNTISNVLTNLPAQVSSIRKDKKNNFYLSMSNGGVRKYNSDFTSFTVVSNTSTDDIWSLSITANGSLVYAKRNTNQLYRLQTGAVLTGTPTKTDVGTHDVVVRASNTSGSTDQSFTITVSDRVSPIITTQTPANNALDVSRTPSLSITFDEKVKVGTSGLITLNNGSTVLKSYDLATSDRNLIALSADEKTISFAVNENLPTNTMISVALAAGVISDAYDNAFAGFTAVSNSWSFTTISKVAQTISFTQPPSKTYGDAAFTLGSLTSAEGLPVTYTAADPTVVSISGNQATILQAGTTTITAAQAGNDQYLPAEVTQSLVVARRAITVRAYTGQFKMYGVNDPTLSYQVTSGSLVSGDTFTGLLSRVAGESVNNYAITQGTLTAGSNYDLTFVSNDFVIFKRPVTITAIAGQSKIYGDADPTFTYHITSGNLVNGDTFTGALTRIAGETVNSYAISQGTLSANTNYDLTFVGNDFTITKRAITVSANAGQTKVYGETDPALSYQITTGNLITGDTFAGSLSRATGEAVNTYAITQGTLSAGANYELTYAGNDFSITKRAVTVSANAGQTKVYGESDPVFTYQITSGNLVIGDTFTGALSRAAGESVNTYAITQGTLSVGANYELTYIGQDFAITKRAVTITANPSQAKVYGQSNPVYTYQVTAGNLVTGDTFTGALSRTAGEAVNTYAITQGTLTAGTNYQLTFAGNDFAITKRAITVTANAGQTKIYGESDPVFSYQVTTGNLITGDTFTGALSRATGEAVNTYAITQGSLSAGANYELTYAGNNFAITRRAITVTAHAGQSKIYGETDPAFTYQITTGNLITGDAFTGALSRVTGEAVNAYAINQGTLSAGTNYELTYNGNAFAITKRGITVSANSGQTKTYGESDPVFTYQITTGNLVTGDTFTGALSRSAGESVNTYAITQGTLSAGDNYELTYVGQNFAITKRALTVTANAGQKKVYGETDPVFTYQISSGNLVTGDTFTGALSRATGEAVNPYAITQGTLSAGANYELTYAGNDFAITKRALTVTANAGQTKIYGESDPVFTFQITSGNLITGDTFTGALSRAAGELVNTYAINQGTLSAGTNYDLTFAGNEFAITKRALTVTANTGQTKVYGDTDPELTYQITTGNLVTGDSFTGTLSRDAGEAVNSYAITQGTLSAGTNYELTYTGNDFSISKRGLTITASTGQTKIYGESDPVFTYQITTGNLVAGDTFTGALSRAVGESVNTYAITQGTLTAGVNYELTYTGQDFAITKRAITIKADAGQKKIYGESDPVLSYQIISGNLVASDRFSGKLSREVGENAGTYTIQQNTLGLNANYDLTYQNEIFSISKAALKITADNKSRFVGTANPSLTVTYTGFVSGENSQNLTALPVVTTEANLSSVQGEYPIVPQGAAAANYEITYQNGILKIVPGAPTSVQLASIVVYENRPAGTSAGTLSSTSDDPTATFSYSLVSGNGDTDNKLFAIAENQLKTASILNFEAKSSYTIRVRSTTQHGFSLDRTFTIVLSDVNEAPTLAPVADETICYTTAPMALTMGGISPGPESSQKVTLTIASDNAELFEQLKITDAGKVTYQVKAGQQGTANVTVSVQDNGGTANDGIDITSRIFKITVNPLPVISIVSDKGAVISKGETVQLTASGGTLYSWNNPGGVIAGQQSATVTVRPAETTTYRVLVKTAAGCSEQKEFTIQVQDDYKVVDGTNLLSPNGDGVNDRFLIRNIDMYPNNTVKIFDRAGRLLYSKKNYTDEWDGTFQGSPLAEGTYYYIVDFGHRQLKGFITIVRN